MGKPVLDEVEIIITNGFMHSTAVLQMLAESLWAIQHMGFVVETDILYPSQRHSRHLVVGLELSQYFRHDKGNG